MYKVRDLNVSFANVSNKPLFGPAPRIKVLKGVSFDIQQGSVLGIVGGSGSGKSTLGRAMLRLIDIDSGSIFFDGMDIAQLKEDQLRNMRQRFQMIFQDPMSSLNPRLRVGQIISGPMKLHGMGNLPARVDEALDMVRLPRTFARRYPHELSGGQRQRVGIARAVALRPDFILADEIVSGLDVSTQAQILNLLGELVRDLGLTVAFISHDLSVIRRLCSRVLVLYEGQIVEEGETSAIFDAPRAEYTKELLNAIPLPDPYQKWE